MNILVFFINYLNILKIMFQIWSEIDYKLFFLHLINFNNTYIAYIHITIQNFIPVKK